MTAVCLVTVLTSRARACTRTVSTSDEQLELQVGEFRDAASAQSIAESAEGVVPKAASGYDPYRAVNCAGRAVPAPG